MAFDPDAYIASQPFDPDAYISEKAPDEVVEEVEQAPVVEEMQEGGLFETITEPAIAIAAGAAGQVASGLAGIPSALVGDTEQAAETIRETQESFAEMGAPETQAGAQALQTVGDFMQAGIDIASIPISMMQGFSELIYGMDPEEAIKTATRVSEVGVGGAAAEKVYEATGSPLMGSIAGIAPELAASFIPLSKMKLKPKQSAFKTKIAEQIKAGSTDKTLVKYIVDGAGKVKNDPLSKAAIKQGFDKAVVMAVKGSSPTDRKKMLEMVGRMRKITTDALYDKRPAAIAGDTLLDRVKFVRKVNRNAGQQLDTVAKGLKGQPVDFASPINRFINDLDEMGVTIGKDLKPVFKFSDLEGKTVTAGRNAVKDIVERLSRGHTGSVPDAYELHRVKKYIDNIVTFGSDKTGTLGKVEGILKKLRHNVDEALDNSYPQYKKVNETYADTIGSLNSLQDVAGKKMDFSGGRADEALGTLLRRMTSNAQSRIPLVDAVEKLEGTVKKYGGSFDESIKAQMLFADELDTVFKPVARTGFQSEVGKATKRGVETARRGAVDVALDVGAAAIDKARGINEEGAFKAIESLLERAK